jgi:hypothetical protein
MPGSAALACRPPRAPGGGRPPPHGRGPGRQFAHWAQRDAMARGHEGGPYPAVGGHRDAWVARRGPAVGRCAGRRGQSAWAASRGRAQPARGDLPRRTGSLSPCHPRGHDSQGSGGHLRRRRPRPARPGARRTPGDRCLDGPVVPRAAEGICQRGAGRDGSFRRGGRRPQDALWHLARLIPSGRLEALACLGAPSDLLRRLQTCGAPVDGHPRSRSGPCGEAPGMVPAWPQGHRRLW